MKRSEINAIMCSANEFLQERKFYLPPFAYWTLDDWQQKGQEAAEIVETQLGWDITDFGMGDFAKNGLFLFTIRNGKPNNLAKGTGKLYAEKILIVDVDQVTPMHFHWSKMEDIINRGGGSLMVQLFNAAPDETLDVQTPVRVSIDSIPRTVPAGGVVELKPGESITLTRGMYHKFWAEGARALIGEVSLVNDDSADNRFYEAHGRFPVIEEDELPLHLLVGDYQRYYRLA